MAEKIEAEQLDSTEIKIEEIKISDMSENWQYVSKFEANTCAVPDMKVPRMHEVGDGIDTISSASSIDNSRPDKQGMFSRNYQKSEKSTEKLKKLSFHKQEKENEKVKSRMDKAMPCGSFKHESKQDEPRCNKDIETVGREMEYVRQMDRLERDNERIRKERDNALQNLAKLVHENEMIRKDRDAALLSNSKYVRENEITRREIEELREERIKAKVAVRDVSEQETEDERVRREMEEVMGEEWREMDKYDANGRPIPGLWDRSIPKK